MANNNKNGVMLYSLGGALLISLVTEIVTANHYWKTLSGIALVAVVGILFVTWTQVWTTAWAVLESQDKGVKRVAYGASLFVTLAMIVNGGFILATRNKENREDVRTRQEKAQVEDLRGLDPIVAREILRQRAEERRQERKDQERERAINDTGRKEETSLSDIADGYMSFWVFIVPFAVAALAKFIVLGAIALPGGASGYLPSRGQSPVGPTPGPTPTPSGPSNPAPQGPTSVRPRTTIPVGRNSGGKSPNP
jgi:hypothetical protein